MAELELRVAWGWTGDLLGWAKLFELVILLEQRLVNEGCSGKAVYLGSGSQLLNAVVLNC